jgi:ribose 5-phosphate isomerase A
MVLGLGTGSTVSFAIRKLGELLANGDLKGVRGIPTSEQTADLAREVGIPLLALSESWPRLTIDGADEVEPGLALIKGRGGALLREKIVAHASEGGLVVVADESKLVDALGQGPLPVEIEPFGWEVTLEALRSLECEPELRMDHEDSTRPYVTDGGNYTADCQFASIPDPNALEGEINRIPGALESGLFLGLTRTVVVGRSGGTEIIEGS